MHSSPKWLLLIDVALVITAILTMTTHQTVLFFHIIFILLSFGAFYWNLRGFTWRAIIWVTFASTAVLLAVRNGFTQPEELIEIPLLLSILIIVFIIASWRAGTQAELKQQSETLAQTENNLNFVNRVLENQVAELSKQAAELTARNDELAGVNNRIQRLASQLEVLAQVTQAITAMRDLKELLPRITAVISEKFGFYHVGIFLLDELSAYAVLVAANSEGGKRMLERKHRLKVGEEGIVGLVTSTGKPRIALDVGQDAIFFNNPNLPETHSEATLPLISKNIIVGALDVQSRETAAFSDEDIQMLNLLADQVSLALENARLFADARKALAESEMANRNAVREAWARLPEQQKLLGYRYDVTGAAPLEEPVKLAGSGKDTGTGTEAGSTIVPIALRGEVIGNLIVQSPSDQQWGEDQLDLIKAVAERVALSAENARLFEETQSRAERERTVSEITGKIRQQNDPQAMIQIAIEELRNALGASRVEVIPQTVKGPQRDEA